MTSTHPLPFSDKPHAHTSQPLVWLLLLAHLTHLFCQTSATHWFASVCAISPVSLIHTTHTHTHCTHLSSLCQVPDHMSDDDFLSLSTLTRTHTYTHTHTHLFTQTIQTLPPTHRSHLFPPPRAAEEIVRETEHHGITRWAWRGARRSSIRPRQPCRLQHQRHPARWRQQRAASTPACVHRAGFSGCIRQTLA